MSLKLHDLKVQLSCLPGTFCLIWRAGKIWTIAWFVFLALQGLVPAVFVFLTRLLVDGLVDAMKSGAGWESVEPVFVLALLMGAILLASEFLQGAMDWTQTAQAEYVRDHITGLIHEKSIAADYSVYESPDYYDRLDRVQSDASDRSLALLENGGNLIRSAITLIAMASLLIPYGPWVPVLLVVSTVPALYLVFVLNRQYHRWWENTTPSRRWAHYFDTMLTSSEAAAEVRLFDLGDRFRSNYQALRGELRKERLVLTRNQLLTQLASGALALMLAGLAMGWMAWRALHGSATLGDLALFYQAFSRGQNLMRTLMGSLGQIYSNTLFLGNLFDFLGMEPQIVDHSRPLPAPALLREGIRFRQITFRYPGSDRPALQDFDLTIPAGRVVAIVGANGAGKSTLVKLLCRFYDPEAGCIELDGTGIQRIPLKELRRQITVLFQLPVPYHATLAQNIGLGDIEREPDPLEIQLAARFAGVHTIATHLPRGYDTLLGKWFADGTELSGGEWQRVALARAFFRKAQILVLDEPTSFMDPWCEIDWLDRFRRLAEGRTGIIITHRFTLAMRADCIHVMHEGRIVESGNHDQLIAKQGLYAKSWTIQMREHSALTKDARDFSTSVSGNRESDGNGTRNQEFVLRDHSAFP